MDAASIEVSRRLRHVKTDRLDGERLLAKLIRQHAGERGGWSVVRVPSPEEEDARHLHRELGRLKRERLAHRVRMQSLLVTQAINLISFFAGELRVVTHECSFDVAVGEANLLAQLASHNPLIKVALRY